MQKLIEKYNKINKSVLLHPDESYYNNYKKHLESKSTANLAETTKSTANLITSVSYNAAQNKAFESDNFNETKRYSINSNNAADVMIF
jgi:hypothetical protein